MEEEEEEEKYELIPLGEIEVPNSPIVPYGMVFVNGGKLWGCGYARYFERETFMQRVIDYPVDLQFDVPGVIPESVIFGLQGYYVMTNYGVYQSGNRRICDLRSGFVKTWEYGLFVINELVVLPSEDGRQVTHIALNSQNIAMCDDHGEAWGLMENFTYVERVDNSPIKILGSKNIQMVCCVSGAIFMLDNEGRVFYILSEITLCEMKVNQSVKQSLLLDGVQGIQPLGCIPENLNIVSIKSTHNEVFLLDEQGYIWLCRVPPHLSHRGIRDTPVFDRFFPNEHAMGGVDVGKLNIEEIHTSPRHLWAKTTNGEWYTNFCVLLTKDKMRRYPALAHHRLLSLSTYCVWMINQKNEIVSWGCNNHHGLGIAGDTEFVISGEPQVVPEINYIPRISRVKRSLPPCESDSKKLCKSPATSEDETNKS